MKRTNDISKNKAYQYAQAAVTGKVNVPKYVKCQCREWLQIADGKSDVYYVSTAKIKKINALLRLMVMPKGFKAGKSVYDSLGGYQWLFLIAIICTVRKDDKKKRKYESVLLEICRKNGKTFLIAVMFILLLLLEPNFSQFFSVAPDGTLSRQVKKMIEDIIKCSPALAGTAGRHRFKLLRSNILCLLNDNDYIPLNYSRDRMDAREPSVFLVDEAGALPEAYAIEAMRSGQINIANKLGCVISTKYPRINNPFEDEVEHAKKKFNGIVCDDSLFALLYEPDNTRDWMTDDGILEQGNPLAIEIPEIMEEIKKKRAAAIERPSARENFVTKHCNIIYQGVGTESYVDLSDVRSCKTDKIEWTGMKVYLGIDLAMTTDNCAVAMVGSDDYGNLNADVIAFVPADRVEEKSMEEKINYQDFIEQMKCIACGDRVVDYGTIESFILDIESQYEVKIMGIAYDRYNCLSTASRLEREGYVTVEVMQHSRVLHAPTKLLKEMILERRFRYEENTLLEINFQNSRCTYDTNLNLYVNKKRSAGKVDMVAALIDAVYLYQQNEEYNRSGWVVQIA